MVALKIILRILVFLNSRYRSFGIRDWLASFIGITLLGVINVVAAGFFTGIFSQDRSVVPFFVFASIILVLALPPLLFVLKLRRNGITDADFAVEGGFDYRAALQSGRGGFSFMGVGGSKLTENDNIFRQAVGSARKSGAAIQMLLLDPDSSEIVAALEHFDGAQGYKAKIQHSIEFVTGITGISHDAVKIRLYRPDNLKQLKPFRLFFADGDCLVSPFVPATGLWDRGRQLPQLRVSSQGWPKKDAPTLYAGFWRHFEANWENAGAKNSGDENGKT